MLFKKENRHRKSFGNTEVLEYRNSDGMPGGFNFDGAVATINERFEPKSQDFDELIFTISGELTIEMNNEVFEVEVEDMFIVPRGVKHIIDGKYVELDLSKIEDSHGLGEPIRNYSSEGPKHYHQFVDACLGKDTCTAPFSYAARLTETILLGTIAGRFPNQTLHWDNKTARFREEEANAFLDSPYRDF